MLRKIYCTLIAFVLVTPLFAHKHDSLHAGRLEFIPNQGQWEQNFLFRASLGHAALFAYPDRLTFSFQDDDAIKDLLEFKMLPAHERKKRKVPSNIIDCHSYNVHFIGANPNPELIPADKCHGYVNYFLGNDPSRWVSGLNKYHELTYRGIYPGIDMRLYEKDGNLKYEYIVHPGADPSRIQLLYEGVKALMIRDDNLLIQTSVNRVLELKPYAFQPSNEGNVEVECNFKLKGKKLHFALSKSYDPSKPLIIDPVLMFSSYSGSTADNWGYTATYDSKGFLYAGGNVFNVGYPTTTGAYQTTYGGGDCDIAISKYDTTGSFFIYSTYLGGNGPEVPNSLIVNSSDELFILGTSGSSNFPVTAGAYDTSYNGGTAYTLTYVLNYPGSDIIVAKLSPDGQNLLASTYFGGSGNDGLNTPTPLRKNYADDVRGEIMIDGMDNCLVVSSTQSPNLPTSSSVVQPTFGGGTQDGCILKMDNNLSSLIWCSYWGGIADDACYSIVIDDNDDIYVGGGTTSPDFTTTQGAYQQTYGGFCDGFVSGINTNGNTLKYSSFIGSPLYDQVYFVKRDKLGNIYLLGQTADTTNYFIYNALWNTPKGGQFLMKLNASLSSRVWATAFGTGNGGPDISPTAFMVDLCNKIYLSGWGGNLNPFGGTGGLPVTPNAFQTTTDNNDYYFLVINDDASALVYATFFGGSSSEHVDGGTSRFDRKGRIYQSVCAGCGGLSDFPTTTGAVSNTNNSINCNNGVIKFDFNLPIVVADFEKPPVICLPDSLAFVNTSYATLGQFFNCFWDFGDGNTSTDCSPVHYYTQSGVYDVTLIVSDTGSCNTADTLIRQVVVLSSSSDTLASKFVCQGDFTQIGVLPSGNPAITYQWVPSVGLSSDTVANPFVYPTSTTNYTLFISNGICTDTLLQEVQVSDLQLSTNDTVVCEGQVTLGAYSSSSNLSYQWSSGSAFLDTLNVNMSSPYYSFSIALSAWYFIKVDDGQCSKEDSILVQLSESAISAMPDTTICYGDTISIFVQNLIPANALSFQWSPVSQIISGSQTSSPEVSPLMSTNYIVVSTDSLGCQRTDTVYVKVNQVIPNASYTDVSCYGYCDGTAQVAPSGGTSPFTYIWSGGQTTSSLSNLCQGNYSVTISDTWQCESVAAFQIQEPDSLYIIVTDTTHVVCNGYCDGSATVQALGGTSPYTYQWISGVSGTTASGLCAGVYTVSVADDNGCPAAADVSILDTSSFQAFSALLHPSCYGYCDGNASVNPSFGTTPYTYVWNTGQSTQGINNLCSGVYSATVTEGAGCIRTVFAQLIDPPVLIGSPGLIQPPSCYAYADGQLEVILAGGTPPYQYMWSNGQTTQTASNLTSGTYYVVIEDDNGCIDTVQMGLQDPSPLTVQSEAYAVPCVEVCNGIGIVYPTGSHPPYTYLWSDGQTTNPAVDLCAGTHFVTITDTHGCLAYDTIVVTDSTTFPVVDVWADDDTIYDTQSIQLHSTNIPGYSYSWSPANGLNSSTIPDPIASPDVTTTYTLTITDPFGCEYIDTVVIYVLEVICEEPYIFVPNAFSPNGDQVNDILFVRSNIVADVHLAIFDRWGEKVFETSDITLGWDGTYKGRECDPGVFVYYLEVTCINEENYKNKGNITLIR